MLGTRRRVMTDHSLSFGPEKKMIKPLAGIGALKATGRLGNRRGQALLIAVLLMSVILLVGILFAAVVSYNQEQSARHVDVVAAQLQAEAGVNYASAMLERSPQGADWRPHFVPYTGTGAEVQTDPATWPDDPSQWPNPPAMYEDGTVDYNFFGPDGQPGTEDDYYSDFDVVRGWYPLRKGSHTAPGEFIRFGFFRFPDPNQKPPTAAPAARDSVNLGRGYFLLQVTYDPDPPFEPGDPTTADRMSGYTRIVSIGRSVEESNVFRRLVAYKPLGLTDQMRWITNKSGVARNAVLGVRPRVDMNFSGELDDGEQLLSVFNGPIRSTIPLYWAAQPVNNNPSLTFKLRSDPLPTEGYLRDDFLFAPRGLFSLDGPDGNSGAAVQINGGANVILPENLNPDDKAAPDHVYVGANDVSALAPVDLATKDPVSGVSRYHALTRDSGPILRATEDDPDNGIHTGDPVNIGLYGHGSGIYIDNRNDLQFRGNDGQSDLNQLMNDWVKAPQQGASGIETGWNATYTTYTPPGVEIELFPSEAAVAATATGGIATGDAPPTTAGALWWPRHTPGVPGIKITRHDHRWRRGDDEGGTWHVGEDSGRNVMVVDYPRFPNQVILAEGNVRVKGILPHTDESVPELNRSFDLTIVANGTIYIDGQLMTAQDVLGRREGTNAPASDGILDEDTAKIALLAKDYVCLNPTQLVPQLTSGLVTAAADDPNNPTLVDQHWELYPETGGVAYSQWRMGWPNLDTNGDGEGEGTQGTAVDTSAVSVSLVPIHTASDPGPSGMGFNVYNEASNQTRPFLFPGGAVDPYTFLFVPPGALLAGSIPSPQPYASNAIFPNWQVPGPTPQDDFTNPTTPFDITALISGSIGALDSVSLFHRDPQIGAGSTPYLLKKWKIEEASYDATTGYWLPQGAVHGKVNACMYAQRGSWFVIPGSYFDPRPAQDLDGDGTISPLESLHAARFGRYNYELTVTGTINEDHTAPLEAVQLWTARWAYPVYGRQGGALSLAWGTISYKFDERLRMNRDQARTALVGGVRSAATMLASPESNLPKLPCLPSSPTLIYAGGTP